MRLSLFNPQLVPDVVPVDVQECDPATLLNPTRIGRVVATSDDDPQHSEWDPTRPLLTQSAV